MGQAALNFAINSLVSGPDPSSAMMTSSGKVDNINRLCRHKFKAEGQLYVEMIKLQADIRYNINNKANILDGIYLPNINSKIIYCEFCTSSVFKVFFIICL